MKNIKFLISYNGSKYFGFQRQPNVPTIQGELERALNSITSEYTVINGCSRTDTGVHAREYCFNAHINNPIPLTGLEKAMNSRLPPDICVINCEEVSKNFHARFDALGKEYLYIINTSKTHNVFRPELELHYPYTLNTDELNRAAKIFIGKHDFSAFCKAEAKAHLKSTVRTIYDFRIERDRSSIDSSVVRFYISGNGFLHNMVRIIIGTLIYYAQGKRNLENIKNALETGQREDAGITAPACGLYLNKVFYF